MDFFSNLKTWLTHTAWPVFEAFMKPVVHDEIAALTPIAEAAVANLMVQEAQALATGNAKNTGHILAAVVTKTEAAATAAGLSVGTNSLLVAVGAAAAKAPELVAAKSASN